MLGHGQPGRGLPPQRALNRVRALPNDPTIFVRLIDTLEKLVAAPTRHEPHAAWKLDVEPSEDTGIILTVILSEQPESRPAHWALFGR